MLKPDSGTATVDGYDVTRQTQEVLRRIGALPDAHGLYPRLTARENIRYYGQLRGLAGPALEQRIDELVAVLDMQDFIDRRTEGFSNGQRIKVSIARALVNDPPNVLLDEPTNGLDVMSTRAMRDFIRHLREQGKCVVFSSHIMQEVSALCDRIVVIANGLVAASGTPDELTSQYRPGKPRRCLRRRHRVGRRINQMKRVWIIFRKEVRDNLRDRRTISSSVLSAFITPALLIGLIVVLGKTLNVNPEEKPLQLPVSGAEYAPGLISFLEERNVEILPAPADPAAAVRDGSQDVILIIASDYPEAFRKGEPAPVQVILDTSRQSASASMQRVRSLLNEYSGMLGMLRLQARG